MRNGWCVRLPLETVLCAACVAFGTTFAGDVPVDSKITELGESATLSAKKIASTRKKEGKPLYDWGLGQSPFPVPAPLVEAVRDHANDAFYAPVEGILPLRQALVARYGSKNYPLTTDDVIVGSGLKQLLYDCQRVFDGRIIHVVPYWVSYADQTLILDKETDLIRAKAENQFKVTPQEVEAVCQRDPGTPRMIIFNNPVNPTGVSYSAEELEALAAVFRKYHVTVFADEIYLGCHHHGKKHSISEYLPEGTIRASSLSKEFACGGYRLGWLTFSKELRALRDAMTVLGSNTYSCAPVPMQYAAVVATRCSPELNVTTAQSQRVLEAVGCASAAEFSRLGLNTTTPDAGWYLLLGFERYREALAARGIGTSQELANVLADEVGMIFVPGEAFGMYPEQLQLRASYIDFDGADALDQMRHQPQRFLTDPLSANMKEGLHALEQWLQNLSHS